MKKRTPDKFWFPWWPGKWIFGSVRIEFNPAERGIWVDLLSFASMDDGYIRANEQTPYLLQQLAGMLIIPEKELEAAINKFIKNKKLTKFENGTLYITKWDKYQFTDRHKRRFDVPDEEISPEPDIKSKKEDGVDKTEDTILNNNIEQIRLKENIEEEKAILKELKEVKNFPRDEEKIINYFRKLKEEFPKVDALKVVKEFYPYSLKKPLTKNSNPFSRIRRFFINQAKWNEERDKELKVGQTIKSKSKEIKMPDNEWDTIAKYLKANGKEEEEIARFLGMTNKWYGNIQEKWESSEKKPEEFVRMILAAEMEAKTLDDPIDYDKIPELELEKVPSAKTMPEQPPDPPDRGTGRRRTAGDSGYQQRHLDLFFEKWWAEHGADKNQDECRANYMKLTRSGNYKPTELFEKPELVERVS